MLADELADQPLGSCGSVAPVGTTLSVSRLFACCTTWNWRVLLRHVEKQDGEQDALDGIAVGVAHRVRRAALEPSRCASACGRTDTAPARAAVGEVTRK